MSLKRKEKIPLPNNPYKIYSEDKGNKRYHKAPFPNYIAKILGKDPENFSEEYQVNILVDRGKEKIEFQLQEKK
ncbi:MAG: hypothetical protein BTN85_0800 [Candidatus Methanohalarchaeum thermophilum]|uniref:Uncharacterized protein n=1 Tax=Methanohalarchaeum thermophilum TaxID=1903181 RepID=A0A1Q6DVH4_METT1|nr:MAG: hypothetical protein BTN85_0800 [Candidatus Methanohalarchaeum thermophilum]